MKKRQGEGGRGATSPVRGEGWKGGGEVNFRRGREGFTVIGARSRAWSFVVR